MESVDEFGTQSEAPSHPELLDWLAIEFMEKGWSRKELHRLIVSSATYRQDSDIRSDLLAADPDNILLTRGPRFRLDGEVVRDMILKAPVYFPTRWVAPESTRPNPPASPLPLRQYQVADFHRRRSLSTQPLHLVQAHRPLRRLHCLRRADRRNLRG